jgi:predicted enzyme related to lactoylglutathione lyase
MENKYRVGQFVWRELMTSDIQKARGFYGELLGWTFTDMPMPTGTYTLVKKGEALVAGMMPTPPDKPMPTAWLTYISVANVDDCLKAAGANGGATIMPPMDVPGVGRFAMMSDATGGVVGVLRNATTDGPAPDRPGVGTFCWESLMTTDLEKAKAFYGEVVGWTAGPGPGATTVMKAGEAMVADFGPAPHGMPSAWMLHVVIEKLETARARAEQLGGKVMVPEIAVPKVGRMAFIADPTGGMISLFEPDMSGSMPSA